MRRTKGCPSIGHSLKRAPRGTYLVGILDTDGYRYMALGHQHDELAESIFLAFLDRSGPYYPDIESANQMEEYFGLTIWEMADNSVKVEVN